jgi:hypothetical protein
MLCRSAALTVSILLCGCVDYYARQNEVRLQHYRARCEAYGLQFGTRAFANCMQNLDSRDAATRAALVAANYRFP